MTRNPILRALEESGIELTQKGKHATKGWIQMECPFCVGKPGFFLGYNLSRHYFNCWRCGWKPVAKVLKAMTSLTADEIWKVIRSAKDGAGESYLAKETPRASSPSPSAVSLPPEARPGLCDRARDYLLKRRFPPAKTTRLWSLHSTGPSGRYKYRIIIPVAVDGVLTSFQARDYTGKAPVKYLAPPNSSILKQVLYGWDYIADGCAIVVEGVTDVWRLGPGAVATFGTGWKAEQRNLLGLLRKVLIAFDPEPEAQDRARRLADELTVAGTEVMILDSLDVDPGDLSPKDVQELRNLFVRWKSGFLQHE